MYVYIMCTHSQRSKQTAELSYQCPTCGLWFDFQSTQKREDHERTHSGDRPFVCAEPRCGESFAQAATCTTHFKLAHVQEKAHKCTICGASYGLLQWLTLHNTKATHPLSGTISSTSSSAAP